MKRALFFTTVLSFFPLYSEAAQPLAGSSQASVQLVVYGDIACPYTRKFMGYIDRFEAEYGSRIGIQFAQFPLPFHAAARPAAIAALCAARQDKLRPFLEEAFAHQDSLTQEFFLQAADKIGIRDPAAFGECIQDKATDAEVAADLSAGQKADVQGTPTIFLRGEIIRGVYPYAEFKKKIDQALR